MFEETIVGGSVPKEYIPGVEKGLNSAKDNGAIAGFPVIDFKAVLRDGNYRYVDSSVMDIWKSLLCCFSCNAMNKLELNY